MKVCNFYSSFFIAGRNFQNFRELKKKELRFNESKRMRIFLTKVIACLRILGYNDDESLGKNA